MEKVPRSSQEAIEESTAGLCAGKHAMVAVGLDAVDDGEQGVEGEDVGGVEPGHRKRVLRQQLRDVLEQVAAVEIWKTARLWSKGRQQLDRLMFQWELNINFNS